MQDSPTETLADNAITVVVESFNIFIADLQQ
jgi:hypothetical protein